MNNNLHNMSMVNTYLENANNQLEQALANLEKFVNIDNMALYNDQIMDINNTINNQLMIVKNNIIPKIQEMD